MESPRFPAELIQRHLQRCFPSLCILDQRCDLSHFGLHSHFGHKTDTSAVGDKTAGINHVLPLCQRHFSGDAVRRFLHVGAFAGECALVCLERCAVHQSAVCRDLVASLQENQVAYSDLLCRQNHGLTVTKYLCRGRGQLFQIGQRLFRLHGLHRSQNCIHGDNGNDNDKTFQVSGKR